MSEHEEQKAVIKWCDDYAQIRWRKSVNGKFPIFAVPNAAKRKFKTAAYLIAEGLRSGVLDLFMPIARGGFHGLAIEMKYDDRTPFDEQEGWLEFLSSENYKTCVCWSAAEAIKEITVYMELGTP
jgi:hypothetical protein